MVKIANDHLNWYLRNSRTSGPGEIVFAYGVTGDVPVVGDWDGNGTWTPGVVRGRDWLLRNSNTGGSAQLQYAFGRGGHTPVPGMWLTTITCSSVNLPMTAGMVKLQGQNLTWFQRFSHTSGSADRTFAYARYNHRPFSGDWNSADCIYEFGPGVVQDNAPGYPSGLQRWLLRYRSSGGTADLDFPWEAIRP